MPPHPPNLLTPPQTITPQTALLLSQKAPRILSSPPSGSSLPWPLSLLFSPENPSTWTIHENLLLSSLRTGDDASARKALDRLTTRFGADNERIVALRGIYEEAQAKTDKELEALFHRYEKLLRDDPTNFAVRKRRIAVLKSLGRTSDAITALTVLLENSPTDVEAWAEASELYASQGALSQAIFCMEEVLVLVPNAWSAHAQLGTLHYLQATSSSPPNISSLSTSLRYFSRALELNDSYLRGFYGLKLVSKSLIPLLSDSPTNTASSSSKRKDNKDKDRDAADDEDLPPPSLATVKKLEELATSRLGEIIRNYSSGRKGWTGYDEAEVIAARELLDRDGQVER
ncbi:TPR-like protein [Westerdykella ornata]|uniref:ER membrane protein complex subunit 2 n=1 Tax=Westerdykella ornata TaxID=318751 RepID=A0A6A6JVT3_WESOR|nr:TPR-like protein [Westerdykella ornata]KAF2280721.1 TPR-like protein [Westerdykella ornata]